MPTRARLACLGVRLTGHGVFLTLKAIRAGARLTHADYCLVVELTRLNAGRAYQRRRLALLLLQRRRPPRTTAALAIWRRARQAP